MSLLSECCSLACLRSACICCCCLFCCRLALGGCVRHCACWHGSRVMWHTLFPGAGRLLWAGARGLRFNSELELLFGFSGKSAVLGLCLAGRLAVAVFLFLVWQPVRYFTRHCSGFGFTATAPASALRLRSPSFNDTFFRSVPTTLYVFTAWAVSVPPCGRPLHLW